MSVALSLLEAFPALAAHGLTGSREGLRLQDLSAELRLPQDVRLRSLTGDDRDAVMRTVARCTPETREARFHEPLAALPLGWARAMCTPPGRGVAVAAVVEGVQHRLADQPGAALGAPYEDEVVAVVHVEPGPGRAELSILVEDAYQRSGLGLLLLCAALAEAARAGLPRVQCHVLPENQGIRRLLTSVGLPMTRRHDDGKQCWVLDLRGLAAGSATRRAG